MTHSITEATDVPAYWKQVNQPTYLGRWQRLTTTESFCLTAQRRVCENLSQVMRFVGHLDLSEQMCSLHRFCIGRRKVSSNFIFIFLFFGAYCYEKSKHFRSCPLQSAGTWKVHLPSHYDEKTSHISQTFNTSKMRRCLIPHKLSRLCRIYRPIDRSLSRRSRFKRGLQKPLTNKNYVELLIPPVLHFPCTFCSCPSYSMWSAI